MPAESVPAKFQPADFARLRRWQRLLDVTAPNDVPPGETILGDLRTARGRSFMVSAVAAAERLRRSDGVTPLDLPPLTDLPARRPAIEGALVADAVWTAYLRHLQQHADADAWLRSFIDTLAPTALVFTANDNPEPWWQNEMVILHALHSFALRSSDAVVVDKTLACADFHLREIQPDHATNEPWAVHAYASHPDGNVTAETLLHAGYIQHAGQLGPVARLIARDAASALAVFLSR